MHKDDWQNLPASSLLSPSVASLVLGLYGHLLQNQCGKRNGLKEAIKLSHWEEKRRLSLSISLRLSDSDGARWEWEEK